MKKSVISYKPVYKAAFDAFAFGLKLARFYYMQTSIPFCTVFTSVKFIKGFYFIAFSLLQSEFR